MCCRCRCLQPRRRKRVLYFENRKQFFLIKSPFLSYEKSKHEKYATIKTQGDFPQLVTPITDSKHTINLQRVLKKPINHTPTHEKVLKRSLEVSAPDIIPSLKEEMNYNIVNLMINNIPIPQHADTEFNGFRLTRDKLSSLTRKFHSTITVNHEFKSLDGFKVRLFMIASTRMKALQLRKTSYANKSQIKKIRNVMIDVIERKISKMNILEFVERMAIKCGMSSEIRTKCENIYPLEEEIHITKIKVLEKPPKRD